MLEIGKTGIRKKENFDKSGKIELERGRSVLDRARKDKQLKFVRN